MISITHETVCLHSDDVVSREIEGELIIVPIASGIGDLDDELYTLNESGREIWQRIDGRRTLGDIINQLASLFEAPLETVTRDVIGLVDELARRRLVHVLPTEGPKT